MLKILVRVADQGPARHVSGEPNSIYPAKKSSIALRAMRYWLPMRLACRR
ncbi:MAG: hypothetical protein OXI80_13930 [Caldilineaceae bacterium]|nr:hypothetical protein [Caldilineaceae bacterium]MDE0338764.1 hypothetical protein [Caldilineaceae bacterium]